MKRILTISVLLLISAMATCQDSTLVTLSTKARLVQTLIPSIRSSEDTTYINLFNRWIQKYNSMANPGPTTQVVVDSISVDVVTFIYDVALGYPQGAQSVGADFRADVQSIRQANSNLNRLLTAIDTKYDAVVPDSRQRGKKILTGKN